MPTDNSTGQPGPMGWWLNENESPLRTRYVEKTYWEKLQASRPAQCTRHPAKDADPVLLRSLRERQAANGIEDGIDLTVLLTMLFGENFRWLRQLIGSCVASGGMRAAAIRSCWEIVILGQPEETLGLHFSGRENLNHFGPYSYKAGRKLGGIDGSGDGSFCGAHIDGLFRYGQLPCDTVGLESDAYPEPQSTSLYRRWGGGSDQLLNKHKAAGQQFKLLESEEITSAESLKTVVTEHFKPCMICSSWAFRPDHQHSSWRIDGSPVWIYQRDRGNSWAHNMTLAAVCYVAGNWYVKIVNSWGDNAHKNGDYFWIPLDLMAQWLQSAEVRTIGDLTQRDPALPIGW